jgi:hypothetical protein
MYRLVVAKQKVQTDRHRIKSYTFLYFKHQSYTFSLYILNIIPFYISNIKVILSRPYC